VCLINEGVQEREGIHRVCACFGKFLTYVLDRNGVGGSTVRDTALPGGRLRFRFPEGSLIFLLTSSDCTMTLRSTQPLT
jgi:hypothetical protein